MKNLFLVMMLVLTMPCFGAEHANLFCGKVAHIFLESSRAIKFYSENPITAYSGVVELAGTEANSALIHAMLNDQKRMLCIESKSNDISLENVISFREAF